MYVCFLPGGSAGSGSSEVGTQGPYQQTSGERWKGDRGLLHSAGVHPDLGLRYRLLVGFPLCRQQISPGT